METENKLPYIIPENKIIKRKCRIMVIGVGGGGSNAVNRILIENINNVKFMVCNTDSQALERNNAVMKLQLGSELTQGLGAGCDPEKGKNAALESIDEIKKMIDPDIKMVFITAGMGGGTGTGAAPIIAKLAREMGLVVIAVVTYPFRDEGYEALQRAYDGVQELNKYVDSILIVDNEKIYTMYGDLSIDDAFKEADNVVVTAVKGISEIITGEGFINVDLADVTRVTYRSGMALMGIGFGQGENRAVEAIENAFTSPLLNDYDLRTAQNGLINISSRRESKLTAKEMKLIMDYFDQYAGGNIKHFKRGIVYDDNLKEGEVKVTVVTTGFKMHLIPPSRYKRDNGDIIKLKSGNDDEEGAILLSLIGDSEAAETAPSSLFAFKKEDITPFTPESDLFVFENEPALYRIKRNKLN